jgi:hypothetical protein
MNTPSQLLIYLFDGVSGCRQADVAHGSVVCYGMVLGKIVGSVDVSFVPVVFKLCLGIAILEPKVAHIHYLGTALFDFSVGNANGGTIVAANVGGRLGMAHFGEGHSHWDSILAVVKHAAGLGFGSGGEDDFENGVVGMDSAVVRWLFVRGVWLSVWVAGRSLRKKWPPMRLRVWRSDRYDASECWM